VKASLKNDQCIPVNEISESMFLANPESPCTRQVVAEAFGFAETFRGISAHVSEEAVDAFHVGSIFGNQWV
jgi:hypothetical protein